MKFAAWLKAFLYSHDKLVHIGLILTLGLIGYAQTFTGELQFDDFNMIRFSSEFSLDKLNLRSFLHRSRWFADMTFILNRHFHGEQVLGYHVVNLTIHLASAMVVYFLLRGILAALLQECRISEVNDDNTFLRRFIPVTVAAFFVCHPIQTQAVTYIAQRYTSLATLLYLASLLAYLKARLAMVNMTFTKNARRWCLLCVLLAILAMKSKEISFTLPVLMIGFEVILFRGRLLKNRFFLAGCAALLLIIPLCLLYEGFSKSGSNLFSQLQTASAETETITRSDYLITQIKVVATYLRLLILPVRQNLDYDYPVYHSLFTPQILAALSLHILLTGLAVVLFLRSRRSSTSDNPLPGVPMRLTVLGIFWFYLTLSVESSVIPIRDVIYEHRLYLPSVGFFMAVTAGSASLFAFKERQQGVLWLAVVLLCIIFTAGTICRNRVWASEIALWQDVLEKSPNKARVRYNVGFLYYKKALPEKALPHLVRAVELDPGQDKHWITLNSAVALLGVYEERCFAGTPYNATDTTVEPRYRQQWRANSYNNLGLAYEYAGNRYLARENYLKATTLNPSLDLAWYNLAMLGFYQRDVAGTEAALKKLAAINPELEQKARLVVQQGDR
jgi:hypothetical protein